MASNIGIHPSSAEIYLSALTTLFKGSKEQFQARLIDDCCNVSLSRPLSWDFCYYHFQSQSEKYFLDDIPPETLDRGALELSSYLASFGMFRSAEMKKVNRCFFEPIIAHLFKVAKANGIHSFNAFKDINLQQLRALISGVDKVSSLNTFFYKFSRSKKMGTIRKEVPIFYLTASGRGSSL